MRVLLALLLSLALPTAYAQGQRPAEVAVLHALHRFHEQVPAYSTGVLRESLLRLAPDVLCIEVGPERFAQLAEEKYKVEYPEAVYPLLGSQGYRVYPMEPAAPRDAEIAKPYLKASEDFEAADPEGAKAFSAHTQATYELLRTYWRTPAQVNDAVTDQLLRAKHAQQEALKGEGERKGWHEWNMHFLSVIRQAAAENPGKRIVVVVGAEHGYWLREHLATEPGVQLLDTAALLAD